MIEGMTFASPALRRALAITVGSAVTLALAGCAGSADDDGGGDEAIIVGTTDKVTTLDPAGSYDNGSFAVMIQVYPFLMNSPYGSPDVAPDIAESAEFTSPTEYTVTLREGLTFANGHELTSSDVKFSFDRVLAIADPNGPSSLLYNLESVDTPDDLTAVFHLVSADDQVFPQILSSNAGPIVDEEVFAADALTPDDEIVSGQAFAGQFTIESYDFNNLISYVPFEGYGGALPQASGPVTAKYYADASNLKLDVQEGAVDVAHRSLSATDVADLAGDDRVTVHDGPGGEIRYLVFNFDTQPYGAKTAQADPMKATAVRQAVAHLIDRDELADQVYKGTYTPLYSFVPAGLTGSTEVLKERYGDGEGAPSAAKARAALEAAGVSLPVDLSLQYNADHYGPSSGDEYALIKSQLEADGLFRVSLQSTEWVQYSKDRTADLYPAYQLGWFADYSDADNYLSPFFLNDNFLANHYSNPEVDALIRQQSSTADQAERTALIEQVQALEAADLSTVPYLQGAQVAVAGTDVDGVTLDASFKFRYAPLTKG